MIKAEKHIYAISTLVGAAKATFVKENKRKQEKNILCMVVPHRLLTLLK